jgi:hydroxymethylbilane synthase
MHLIIGSRGSKLALWQADWVKGELLRHGHTVEIEIIKTTGDKIAGVPLASLRGAGTKGLFTKEIEEALLAGGVQLAVHSLKDLPTELPAGLVIGAVPPREDPRDALVCGAAAGGARDWSQLPPGASVGTSSLRRSAQLLHSRPDLKIEPLRGNLDTRLRKLDQGGMAAVVLACAGLRRMGWEARITQCLPPEVSCPAVGQGALGIEVRADDAATRQALAPLDDAAARAETAAERALLARLGGGCQVPIGALARWQADGRLSMIAVVASPDGRRLFRAAADGRDPTELGQRLAGQLLRDGAQAVLDEVYGRRAPLPESP